MRRVYYARAMDGLTEDEVLAGPRRIQAMVDASRMAVIDPYMEQRILRDRRLQLDADEFAREIVDSDLELLRRSDVVLMDLSLAGRIYVGCICELVYAHLYRIPVVVNVGSTGIEERIWLRYHASKICHSLQEAVDSLEAAISERGERP